MLSIMSSQVQANNLEAFKKYIDSGKGYREVKTVLSRLIWS